LPSKYIPPPASEQELLSHAELLAGKTLGQLARETGLPLPVNHRQHKGWTGKLAELCLGATAASLAEPDFQLIGIELKTVPINRQGKPKESTYVCTLNLADTQNVEWESSIVRKKLSRVLWLPVEADPGISFAQRRFGSAMLWSPDPGAEAILRNDWEEIMDLVVTGNLDQISSSQGSYLQIRPKAASGSTLGKFHNRDGTPSVTLPRGFYLRASFTRSILCEE
jgi:DNA mismatch repair protein MutH